MTGSIVIKGISIPIAAVGQVSDAVKTIILGIGAKQTPQQIIAGIEPLAIPVLEEFAAVLFPPFGGTIVEILVFLLAQSHPMTRDEEQSYWDKAQGFS